jgi:hypothetical protein
MASLTLAQVSTQVRDLLRDNTSFDTVLSDDNNTYSPEQVKEAINFAVKRFCELTRASYIEPTIVVDNEGFAPIPTDYIKIEEVKYSGKSLTKSSAEFEDMKNPEWEEATSPACKRWVPWSGDKIKLTPISWSTSTVSASLGYIQAPTSLASDTDTVDARVPEYEQNYLKYAAAWYLLQMKNDQQNIDLANLYMKQFTSLISQSRS